MEYKTLQQILETIPMDTDGERGFTRKEVIDACNRFAAQELQRYKESQQKELDEYKDRESRFILTLVKVEQTLNLLEKVQAHEPEEFKRGIDHIKKNIKYVIDKNIDRLPPPPNT